MVLAGMADVVMDAVFVADQNNSCVAAVDARNEDATFDPYDAAVPSKASLNSWDLAVSDVLASCAVAAVDAGDAFVLDDADFVRTFFLWTIEIDNNYNSLHRTKMQISDHFAAFLSSSVQIRIRCEKRIVPIYRLYFLIPCLAEAVDSPFSNFNKSNPIGSLKSTVETAACFLRH